MGSTLEQRAREARFWELLRQGSSRSRACDAVGADRRQGYRSVEATGGRDQFAQRPRTHRFLSLEERLRIADLRLAGTGPPHRGRAGAVTVHDPPRADPEQLRVRQLPPLRGGEK